MSGASNKVELFHITYRFIFENGNSREFRVDIDSSTLINAKQLNTPYPEWTKYKNFQCPHCPHDRNPEDFCPVATGLDEIIRFFSDNVSYEQVTLEIETVERTYTKKTSLQDGVSGIIGILMVTSGCQVMGKLKPMVRFHLPFCTLQETEYRAMSMYMLAQYFRNKWGKEPDWNMRNLIDIYENIRRLNQNVAKRIADLEAKDTSINSLIVLNNFADYVTFSLDDDMLFDIEKLFLDYMD